MKKLNKVFVFLVLIISMMLLLSVKTSAAVDSSSVTDTVKTITFDADYYLNTYSDLKAAFGTDTDAAYNHFLTCGISEGRCASLTFDIVYYVNNYSDLKAAFGTNYEAAYNHFITLGLAEGRTGCLVYNANYYLNNNSDVKAAFGTDYKQAYLHFVISGMAEGRQTCESFNVRCYLRKYADLTSAFGATNYEAGFEHYLTLGINEKRVGTHEYKTTTVAATCTEAGYTTVACDCGLSTTTTVIPATGHTVVTDEAVAPSCTETGLTEGSHCSVCNEVLVAQEEVPATGHSYDITEGDIEWTWAEDYSTATASVICSVCEEAQEFEATISGPVVTTEAKCKEAGEKEYTATVTIAGEEYTDVATEEIPELGHTFNEDDVEWAWVEDENSETGWYVTATRTCERYDDCEKSRIDVATVEVYSETPATCSAEGEIVYVASSKVQGVTYYDYNTVTIDKIDHSYDTENIAWDWEDDYSSVTATFTCTECDEDVDGHTASVTATLEDGTIVETADPEVTCEQDGNYTYVATVTFEEEEYTDTQTQTIEASEEYHNFVKLEVSETTGNYVLSDGTDLGIGPATCQSIGYVATACEYCGKLNATLEAKTDHTYVITDEETDIEWTWAEDYSSATAAVVCSVCEESQKFEATVSGPVVTTEATCTTAGEQTYTATVTIDGEEYTNKATEEIAALGHDFSVEVSAEEQTLPAATCTDAGYTETKCSRCDEVQATVVDALGHSYLYKDAYVTWTEDSTAEYGWTATITRVCERYDDCGKARTDKATVTGQVTSEATCSETGVLTLTASKTVQGEAFEFTKDIDIDTIDHTYADPEEADWTWADDYSSASVTVTCIECEHEETLNATVTSETKTEATCESPAVVTYTATVYDGEGEDAQVLYTTSTEGTQGTALGHDYVTVPASTLGLKAPCEEESENSYIVKQCTRCGDTTYSEAEASDHDETTWTWTSLYNEDGSLVDLSAYNAYTGYVEDISGTDYTEYRFCAMCGNIEYRTAQEKIDDETSNGEETATVEISSDLTVTSLTIYTNATVSITGDVTLSEDATEDDYISVQAASTLNITGNVSGTDADNTLYISNSGTLVITGDVSNVTIENSGTVILNGDEITDTDTITITSSGVVGTAEETNSSTPQVIATVTEATSLNEMLAWDSVTTVQVTESIESATFTVPTDREVTLDLNGKTLSTGTNTVYGVLEITGNGTINGTVSSSDKKVSCIEVNGEEASLTLTSGTITSDQYGMYALNDGSITINGGEISAYYAALGGNNTTEDMNFYINGGELTATYGPAVFMPGQGNLIMTDGTLNGGIGARMGTITISGGTINSIEGDIDSYASYYSTSGNIWLADAIFVMGGSYTSSNTESGNALNLTISENAVINCLNSEGSAVAIYDAGKVTQNMNVSITGGTFSVAGDVDKYKTVAAKDVITSIKTGYGVIDNLTGMTTNITVEGLVSSN